MLSCQHQQLHYEPMEFQLMIHLRSRKLLHSLKVLQSQSLLHYPPTVLQTPKVHQSPTVLQLPKEQQRKQIRKRRDSSWLLFTSFQSAPNLLTHE
uniref:Uncharacterized protein n=1 Tax=Octopus bimaculoides TaxID=37653 RepID=A0A0L8G2H6_OCTBM